MFSSLSMLQHADTTFPSGSISFSHGLESLANNGNVVGREGVWAFLEAQIRWRWNTLDRAILVHSCSASNDIEQLCYLDALLHAQSLVTEQRNGSIQMGLALLAVHQRLGTNGCERLLEHTRSGELRGHLPVVQGALWSNLGFDVDQIQVMAAHGLCTGVLGAAVRLSSIGFVDAQRIHSQAVPLITELLLKPVPLAEQASSFVPAIDVMSMRHETETMRLFMS